MPVMAAKSVQISIDEALLAEVDQHSETKRDGRSAFIRRALRAYLAQREKEAIDAAYERAYAGRADEVFAEFAWLMGAQAWPDE